MVVMLANIDKRDFLFVISSFNVGVKINCSRAFKKLFMKVSVCVEDH